jgi:hypothetical protein
MDTCAYGINGSFVSDDQVRDPVAFAQISCRIPSADPIVSFFVSSIAGWKNIYYLLRSTPGAERRERLRLPEFRYLPRTMPLQEREICLIQQ